VQKEHAKIESEHIAVAKRNVELSTTMLALAERANTSKKEDINDPRIREQLDELEMEMKTSRQRWRIMKGTTSATIVGSGVDWARDATLLGYVLDEDGNED
jgi:hypothetical protein